MTYDLKFWGSTQHYLCRCWKFGVTDDENFVSS